MPKARERYNPYEKLQVLLMGKMQLLGMDQATLAAKVGCCDKTVGTRLKNPERFTLDELSRFRRALNIPIDELRAVIPS